MRLKFENQWNSVHCSYSALRILLEQRQGFIPTMTIYNMNHDY